MKIQSDIDIEEYLTFFKSLDDDKVRDEVALWESKIQNDDYTYFEFLAFMKVLELLEINSNDDVETIDILSKTIDELRCLSDYTLDNYEGSKVQTNLLDNINKSLTECEILYKYYNEKIIN